MDSVELEDFYEKRMEICKACPLGLETVSGLTCNHYLWLNLEDKTTTSKTDKPGYVRGCNCNMTRKAKISFAKCVAGKW